MSSQSSTLGPNGWEIDAPNEQLVTATTNPVTGGSDFSSDVSTLKLPSGVTDLTGGVGGGGGGGSLGTYASTAALETAYPAASKAGFSALVGSAAPYDEYVSNGVAWVIVPTVNSAVTLTGATNLTRADHANRQIIFNGANATLTIQTDALSGWTADDTIEVHTLNASSGVPTLSTPDGKTITGSATKIIGATRKGADQWTVGTTDPAVAAAGGTSIDLFGGDGVLAIPNGKGTTAWSSLGNIITFALVGTYAARTTSFNSLGFFNRMAVTSAAAINSNAYTATTSGAEQNVAPSTNPLHPTARVRVVFGVSDALTGCRTGAGFFSATPGGTVEPSTLTNSLFFGADSTDTQLFLMSNDGTGNATKTALNGGTGFPANTNSLDMYDGYIEFVGGATRAANYFIKNRVTGVSASGTITADLPIAGTALRVGAYRNTAANATACALDIVAIASGGFAQMGALS